MTNQFERPMEVTKVESLVDNVATVITSKPLPPGSRICFSVQAATLHAKVVAIKKRDEGLFAVNVRLHSVSKSDRETLLGAL